MKGIQYIRFAYAFRWFCKKWTRRLSPYRALRGRGEHTGLIEWPDGLTYKNAEWKLTYSEMAEVFVLFHTVVADEKKNTSAVALEMLGSKAYSIFAPRNTGGLLPRFGKPTR
jgi:hypothetical protein